jgi:hypothetical protein
MSVQLTELGNEQRRQLIDVRQAFAAWREAARKGRPGSFRWVKRRALNISTASRNAPNGR